MTIQVSLVPNPTQICLNCRYQNFAINLPPQLFLGHHLGFHIFFNNGLLGCHTLFLQQGCFWIRLIYTISFEAKSSLSQSFHQATCWTLKYKMMTTCTLHDVTLINGNNTRRPFILLLFSVHLQAIIYETLLTNISNSGWTELFPPPILDTFQNISWKQLHINVLQSWAKNNSLKKSVSIQEKLVWDFSFFVLPPRYHFLVHLKNSGLADYHHVDS